MLLLLQCRRLFPLHPATAPRLSPATETLALTLQLLLSSSVPVADDTVAAAPAAFPTAWARKDVAAMLLILLLLHSEKDSPSPSVRPRFIGPDPVGADPIGAEHNPACKWKWKLVRGEAKLYYFIAYSFQDHKSTISPIPSFCLELLEDNKLRYRGCACIFSTMVCTGWRKAEGVEKRGLLWYGK